MASRHVKQEHWDAAIDILYGGALALLKAGQGGSGGDLACYLVEVFVKGGKGVEVGERGECVLLFVVVCLLLLFFGGEGMVMFLGGRGK